MRARAGKLWKEWATLVFLNGTELWRAIVGAWKQFPGAFSVTPALLWETRVVEPPPALSVPSLDAEDVDIDWVEPAPTTPPENGPDERGIREHGVEYLAQYVSFHWPIFPRRGHPVWGIFFHLTRMESLAFRIARDLSVGCHVGRDLAYALVTAHELFHFRLSVYALRQEVTLKRKRGLYIPYERNVYEKTFGTPECFEESLANHHALEAMDRQLSPFPKQFASAFHAWARAFCEEQPPGYRDFNRDPVKMRAQLGSQLTNDSKTMELPQSLWVAQLEAPFSDSSCPRYVVYPKASQPSGVSLTYKGGGRIWEIKKADPDPFPSKPHAHDRETGEKLSLADGKIYPPKGKEPIGALRQKELKQFQRFVAESWPEISLPPI